MPLIPIHHREIMILRKKHSLCLAVEELLQLESLFLEERFIARVLDMSDLDALQALRASVIADLANPDCYRLEAETPGFLTEHLTGLNGIAIGIIRAGNLVAYATLSFKSAVLKSLVAALTLPEKVERNAAFFSSAMVLCEARGHGLHHYLIDLRIALCNKIGISHRFATVSPINWRSWGHFAVHKMPCVSILFRPGGFVRLLAYAEAGVVEVPDEGSAILVDMKDMNALTACFNEGMRLWEYRNVHGSSYGIFAPLRSLH